MSEGVWPEVLIGDVRAVLPSLASESVHTCVCSPPYWGLRSYLLDGHEDKHKEIGLEPTLEAHIAVLLEVFREVWRVLRKDGTFWLNYGDCYACAPNGRKAADIEGDDRTFRDKPFSTVSGRRNTQGGAQIAGVERFAAAQLKPKDLVGMPWMLAFALRADGWWLRSDIVWSKLNPMPESVTDRPTRSHEYLFLLAKSERYFMDMDAIREPSTSDHPSGNGYARPEQISRGGRGQSRGWEVTPLRNKRTVWEIATQPTPEAHFATFPEALVEPCILAGTSEAGCCPECGAPWRRTVEKQKVGAWKGKDIGDERVATIDRRFKEATPAPITTGWAPTCTHQHPQAALVPCTVLDPFAGSGTTLRVATRLGRRSIGIELSEEYARAIITKRTAQGGLGL